MNELFFTTLALVFPNTIIIRLFLFALSSNESDKKEEFKMDTNTKNYRYYLLER